MRSPVSRVAAAAIFVLAIVGVALWFHGGGATPAFADFIEPILEAKTVKYKKTTKWTSLSGNLNDACRRKRGRGSGEGNDERGHDAGRRSDPHGVGVWPAQDGANLGRPPGKESLSDTRDQKRATVSSDEGKPEKNADRPHQDAAAGFRVMLLNARNEPGAKRESCSAQLLDKLRRQREQHRSTVRQCICYANTPNLIGRHHTLRVPEILQVFNGRFGQDSAHGCLHR